MSKVGLFFGSFNPVHNGHIEIARYVLAERIVEQVWLIVSPQSPFKESELLLAFDHRFKMAELATADFPRIVVSDAEAMMPVPSYTVDTLHKLRSEHPETEFVLLMGGDNLEGFSGWKDHDLILKEHHIICYARAGANLDEFGSHPRVQVLESSLLDESSTVVRQQLNRGDDVSRFLHPSVHQYLVENQLFE